MEKFTDMYSNDKYLSENDFIRGRDRIGDVLDDANNSLYYIAEAVDVVLRPELRERLEGLYTKEYIQELEDFAKAANQLSGYKSKRKGM